MVERWRGVARKLDGEGGRAPDPLLDHVLGRLTPEMTVLDIGAGIGRWTLPIARKVRRVTAVEPLQGMRQVLVERAAAQDIGNLDVVGTPWLAAEVPPHDVAIAIHATYTTTDLLGFVRKMEASARRSCYLALRIPAHDGVDRRVVRAASWPLARQPELHRGVQPALVGGIPPQCPDGNQAGPRLEGSHARRRRRSGQATSAPRRRPPRRRNPRNPHPPPDLRGRRLPLARRHAVGVDLVGSLQATEKRPIRRVGLLGHSLRRTWTYSAVRLPAWPFCAPGNGFLGPLGGARRSAPGRRKFTLPTETWLATIQGAVMGTVPPTRRPPRRWRRRWPGPPPGCAAGGRRP